MDVEERYKKIGFSLESHVRDSYSEFIVGVEDYENQWEGSLSGLWELFNPVYNALASSRPQSVRKEEWARDLILAYRNINTIKIKLLDHLGEIQGEDNSLIADEESVRSLYGESPNPLDEL